MNKKELYNINKNINKFYNKGYTNFLDYKEFISIKSKLKKNEYDLYHPYKDSEKIILYKDIIPQIKLIEIINYDKLTHREIMGSLYGLNIDTSLIGDIIVDEDRYYFYCMESISEWIFNNLITISRYKIKLKEVNLETLEDYEKKYEKMEVIVSSLRIDLVISKLIGNSREIIKDKIKNKEVILNYEVLSNDSLILKINDIFSIRGCGKYKFSEIIGNTKKDNYIISVLKYI